MKLFRLKRETHAPRLVWTTPMPNFESPWSCGFYGNGLYISCHRQGPHSEVTWISPESGEVTARLNLPGENEVEPHAGRVITYQEFLSNDRNKFCLVRDGKVFMIDSVTKRCEDRTLPSTGSDDFIFRAQKLTNSGALVCLEEQAERDFFAPMHHLFWGGPPPPQFPLSRPRIICTTFDPSQPHQWETLSSAGCGQRFALGDFIVEKLREEFRFINIHTGQDSSCAKIQTSKYWGELDAELVPRGASGSGHNVSFTAPNQMLECKSKEGGTMLITRLIDMSTGHIVDEVLESTPPFNARPGFGKFFLERSRQIPDGEQRIRICTFVGASRSLICEIDVSQICAANGASQQSIHSFEVDYNLDLLFQCAGSFFKIRLVPESEAVPDLNHQTI
jgi:hypothetical protein